jgi:hypothetical protein
LNPDWPHIVVPGASAGSANISAPRCGGGASVVADEFGAVSRRLPIWQVYERARALDLAVHVSAESWQGLGATEGERRRIAASAGGGIWLLRTPEPEPIAANAGTRREAGTTRRLTRAPFLGARRSSRLADRPVVDVALIRALDVGQAAYIFRCGVACVQVKRPGWRSRSGWPVGGGRACAA